MRGPREIESDMTLDAYVDAQEHIAPRGHGVAAEEPPVGRG